MLNLSLMRQFTRLVINPAAKIQVNTRCISTTNALQFNLTYPLCAEPMKKKKKMDPQILKAREDRRRKKLEKQIRRLEKNARQLKPIEELEIPLNVLDNRKSRQRPQVKLTAEVIQARAELQKDWSNYKRSENIAHIAQIDRIMSAQRRALDQLFQESEDLYNEACMPDLQLLPYTAKGPVATPAIKDYNSPDGEYIDVSKKWVE